MASITFNESGTLNVKNNTTGLFESFPYTASWVNTQNGSYNPSFTFTNSTPSQDNFHPHLFACHVIVLDCMIDAKMSNGAQNFDVMSTNAGGVRSPFSMRAEAVINSDLVNMSFANFSVNSWVDGANNRTVIISGGTVTVQQFSTDGMDQDIEADISALPTSPVTNGLNFAGTLYFCSGGAQVGTFGTLTNGKYRDYKQNALAVLLPASAIRTCITSNFATTAAGTSFKLDSSISR